MYFTLSLSADNPSPTNEAILDSEEMTSMDVTIVDCDLDTINRNFSVT